jgi:hypothetical protein
MGNAMKAQAKTVHQQQHVQLQYMIYKVHQRVIILACANTALMIVVVLHLLKVI